MRFAKLSLENVVQVNDKTRLDASLSFSSDETITDIEIQPEASESFISVFGSGDEENWFLDWAYETDGIKTVVARITTDAGTKNATYSINVLSEDDDALFSGDNDLFPYEPDLLNYLPQGKNSWLFIHRKAQERVLAYLDEQRIWHDDGSKYTKAELANHSDPEIRDQFKQWSTFQTLVIIFESLQVSVDDKFQEKRNEYENLMRQARNRAQLRLDSNQDDVLDGAINIRSTNLRRR